jgi:hypothetical protein
MQSGFGRRVQALGKLINSQLGIREEGFISYIEPHTKPVIAMLASLACLVLAGWFGRRIAPVAAADPGKYLGTKFVYIDAQYRVDP